MLVVYISVNFDIIRRTVVIKFRRNYVVYYYDRGVKD